MDAHETALSHDNARLREENERLDVELRRAIADAMQAWEQAGSDRADLNQALSELATARADAAVYRQALEVAKPVLERYEPCGYYCDESVGHVDHPATYAVATALNGSYSGAALLSELAAARADAAALREAIDNVMWMAYEYAQAGGSGGPEMRDYQALEQVLAAYDERKEHGNAI